MKSDEQCILDIACLRRSSTPHIHLIPAQRRPRADSESMCEFSKTDKKTAYERISMKRNILLHSLPNFLKHAQTQTNKNQRNLDIEKYLQILPTLNTNKIFGNTLINPILISTEPGSADSLDKNTLYEELSTDPVINPQEPVFRIKHITLTREDLHSLCSGKNLTKNIVNCYMWAMKQENRNLLKLKSDANKVVLGSTKFAKKILYQKPNAEEFHSPCNLFIYDFLLLPIHEIYWGLLKVDLNENIVEMCTSYDFKKVEEKLNKLFEFLGNELFHFEKREIVLDTWKFMRSQKFPLVNVFAKEDSGVYMLKQVRNIALNANEELIPQKMEDYRREIFETLSSYRNPEFIV